MDEIYLCPDCYAEHQEPLEATLGHLVRCPECALLAETDPPGQALRPPIPLIERAAA